MRATSADFAAARERLEIANRLGRSTTAVRKRWSKVVSAAPATGRRGPVPGSRQSAEIQDQIRRQLAAGISVNRIAVGLGVSHDAVRIVRDGTLIRRGRTIAT